MSLPGAMDGDATGTARRRGRIPAVEIAFALFGVVAFAVANVLTFLMAFPTMNADPQNDVRGPVFAILIAVIVIAFLGRAGRGFSAGFATGFLALSLFLGPCTAQWRSPEGTALRQAASNRRLAAAREASVKRAHARWIEETRRLGLDEATGVRDAFAVTGCTLRFRARESEFPRARDELPEASDCGGLDGPTYVRDAWRFHYRPVETGGHVTGYRLTLTPDSALSMAGPIVETTEGGLVTIQKAPGSPRLIRGSPMPGIMERIDPCIRGNLPLLAGDTGALTLRRVLSAHRFRCYDNLPLASFASDDASELRDDPNAAQMPITAPTVRGKAVVAVYVLRYIPIGPKPGNGYELQVRPQRYAATGLRSYLLARDGSIHVTSEDRSAVSTDPFAQRCESDQNVGCAP